MAKNREPVPKPAESEETDDELVSDSQSDSESEQETQPPPKATIPPPAVSNSSDSVAESDSDTDSSESDLPPKKSDPPKSKPTPASSSAVKRPPLKTTEAQDTKKAKKAEPVKKDSDDVSKKLFQRVFSDEDEIVLLEGMVDFISKKKSDPIVKVDEFLDFVKKLKMFNFDVTRTQLVNKMKRLKVKYENNVGKVKDGNQKKLKKHEKEAFALSESIWGGGGSSAGDGNEGAKENGGVVKKNKNATGRVSDEVEDKEVVAEESGDKKSKSVGGGSSTGVSGVDSVVEKKVMSDEINNVDSEKRNELEKKRKKIELVELELFAMRCEYLAEKARLMAAAKKA